MKKRIISFLIYIMCFSMVSPFVYAEEQKESPTLQSVLSNDLTEAEKMLLQNPEGLVIRIYDGVPYNYADKPLSEIEEIKKTTWFLSCRMIEYLIINPDGTAKVMLCSENQNTNEVTIRDNTEDAETEYLEKLLFQKADADFNGNTYRIKRIVAFDSFAEHQGACIYVETTGGIFIQYYSHSQADPVVYTQDEFGKWGKAYSEYLSSEEHNYNEKGEPLYGGNTNFTSFIEQVKSGKIDVDSITPLPGEPAPNWWWLLIPAVLLVGGGVGLVIICKRRKTA